MNLEEFYRNLDELLECDPGTIKGSDPLGTLEAWDSVNVLGFIAMTDEKYGVNVPIKRIVACRTVDDLAATVADLRAVST